METMKAQVVKLVKKLLKDGKIQGFLGLREANGNIQPYLFKKADELAEMSLGDLKKPGDARYPLNLTLVRLAQAYPEATFGVLVRGCDARGLVELFKWKQLQPEKVVPVGIACPAELAVACECRQPYPDDCQLGDKQKGVDEAGSVSSVDQMTTDGRFGFWMEHFDRCVKCYGCRNVCPMCFCKECALEETDLVQTAILPTENPIFHLTRAVHMAGRCIDCGLCEQACPADIPLRALYKKVAEILASETGYRPGFQPDQKSPLNIIETSGSND
jgi:formate dehydrogenase (coenzyme F420) beta subunit